MDKIIFCEDCVWYTGLNGEAKNKLCGTVTFLVKTPIKPKRKLYICQMKNKNNDCSDYKSNFFYFLLKKLKVLRPKVEFLKPNPLEKICFGI